MRRTSPPPPSREKATKRPARARLGLDARRQQLLALGRAAFASRPYDAVSIDDIAREAGISRSLLFHYFASKNEFHVAVLEEMAASLLAATFPEREGEPLSLLLEGLDGYFAFVEDHAETFGALLGAGLRNDPAAQAIVETTRERIAERLVGYLPPAPAEARSILRASLRGWIGFVEALALDWVRYRDLSRAERMTLAAAAVRIVPGAPELAESRGRAQAKASGRTRR